ncbi:MAG: hypothetical protein CVU41_06635 [Chloroflexi bacterium HGW-Chloroflexi-3]|nr:MAG: hypothetical protein CVU41_06635 [Chloroflexi bacterium HGW-Chloroflexi-3]
MEKKNIWIVAIIVVILVVVCCCVLLVVSGVAYAILQPQTTSQNILESVESIVSPTREPMALPTIDINPNSIGENNSPSTLENPSNIDPLILVQMEKIEQEVEGLRGLPRANDLDRKTLTPEELRQRVMEDFFVDYTEEDVRQDALILNLFGLIERDYDLYELFVELYSEQIAGFYDDETKEMVVVQGEKFAGPERMTYAHEYTHALQDAQYNLKDGLKLDSDYCELDSEYCAAVTALVEGDASFTETQWFLDHSSLKDKQEVLQYYQEYSSPIFDNTPVFLQEDLIFPYVKGIAFVTELYEEGGYAAIDNAFLNPPVSTEQIMHPERYPEDHPIRIELEDFTSLLGDGWEEIDRNTLGEWYTYLMLGKPLSSDWAHEEEMALSAAEGWGGDQYLVYHHFENDEDVLILLSEWDTQTDADEYWQAFSEYAIKRWGNTTQKSNTELTWELDSETVIVRRQSDQVLWIIAPQWDLAEQLVTQFPEFQ